MNMPTDHASLAAIIAALDGKPEIDPHLAALQDIADRLAEIKQAIRALACARDVREHQDR